MSYADVIVDISHEKLDRTFSYHIPENLLDSVAIGSPVFIPFGKGNREITGFVVDITEESKFAPERTKDIIGVPVEALPIEAELIALAAWMRKHFGGTMNQALKTVLPIKKKAAPKEAKICRLILSEEEAKEELVHLLKRARHSFAKERLLRALIDEGEIPWEVVTKRLDVSANNIRDFEKKGWIDVISSRDYRNPLGDMHVRPKQIELNEDQRLVLSTFRKERHNGRPFLLYGVTGSGKTEVYMEMIADVLGEGRQVIVLIPEIALTYQTVMRFYSRFGNVVSIMNSRLSDGERYDQFERARNGDIRIMVGPRSALFTPFSDLGLIIIDEEHETTYKSEQIPKYHATDVAIERARLKQADVVLGSATPALESFYRCQNGNYVLLPLPGRATEHTLPECHIVDLREELKSGNRNMLSRDLMAAIRRRLDNNEQTMLFMNRRGMAGFVSCRACGHVLKCPHCDVSLSLHRDGKMKCHYCGYETAQPKICPECGSKYIGTFKAGTEKLEQMTAELFPDAKILRMDADTTKGKGDHEKLLSAFANREADILIGTQMIVKGHDFSGVTLMGIIAADQSLHASDFRSAERTFALLCQAAGRAGRGDRPGEVFIQTYQPEHYAITFAASQDYDAFYEREIAYRDLMNYPPVGHMLVVQIFSMDDKLASALSARLYELIKEMKLKIQLARPTEAVVSKIKDTYRWAIYVKALDYEKLVEIKDRVEAWLLNETGYHKASVRFDFDPVYGF